MYYLVVRPSTGELMGETRHGLIALAPTDAPAASDASITKAIAPKLLTAMHIAENHQSAMNCEFGSGWEVATLDISRGIIAITQTLPFD